MGQVHCTIRSHTTNLSQINLTSTINSDAANMVVVAELVGIILLACLFLILVALRLLQPRPPNMSVPVEESSDQYGMFAQYPYNQLVVVGHQQPNVHLIHLAPCQNIPSSYIALYLLICAEQMPDVQESIQCSTNQGKAVAVIGGKEYPPPADGMLPDDD